MKAPTQKPPETRNHIVNDQTGAMIFVKWLYFQDDETGNWLATCHDLELDTGGETHAILVENIEKAMLALFKSLIEDGELGAFLRERGWAFRKTHDDESEQIPDVPMSLLMKNSHGQSRTAHA